MSIVQNIGKYDDKFLERVKELAIVQMTPSMIADRLNLQGAERRKFLQDINQRLHPLAVAYRLGLGSGYQDAMDALHSCAVAGDPFCLELLLKAKKDAEIAEMKKELFGI